MQFLRTIQPILLQPLTYSLKSGHLEALYEIDLFSRENEACHRGKLASTVQDRDRHRDHIFVPHYSIEDGSSAMLLMSGMASWVGGLARFPKNAKPRLHLSELHTSPWTFEDEYRPSNCDM